MIDTHCHLCDKRFDKDREQVLDRAFEAGVTHLIEIAFSPAIVPRAHALASRHPNLFLCLGVHPSEAAKVPDDYLATLRDHAGHARVVAIGETGLDFYRDHAPRPDQERWFRAQLGLADAMGLPVVIHQRSALEGRDPPPGKPARAPGPETRDPEARGDRGQQDGGGEEEGGRGGGHVRLLLRHSGRGA